MSRTQNARWGLIFVKNERQMKLYLKGLTVYGLGDWGMWQQIFGINIKIWRARVSMRCFPMFRPPVLNFPTSMPSINTS